MGKVFFVSWALWQKMTFVLACGIVLTIIGGFIKLAFDQRKLKKYSKVEQRAKAAPTPEMLESQRLEAEDDKDAIPFGIRAIESGIEVDGVWISRGNTPVGSVASSANNSRLDLSKLPGHSANNSQLELPQPAHGSTSRASSRAPSSAFDRAVSAERLPDSRSSSPGLVIPDQRSRVPRNNQLRNNGPNFTRNSTTLNALEGTAAELPAASAYQPTTSQNSNSSKSSRNSDESDYMQLAQLAASRPYEAAYLTPHDTTGAAPNDSRFRDLDLLQSHRMSHVAETGQLAPRVRRPGYSGEWASTATNLVSPPEASTSAQGVDYFVPSNKTPSPPMANAILAPLDDYSNNVTSSSSSHGAHPVSTTRQAAPLLETYQPRGPHHDYEEIFNAYPNPYGGASVEQNETRPRRDSDVLRKVNEGFEILRPGTLQTSPPASPDDEKADHERRQSKKLQKKRRTSSGGSKASQFIEQI